MESLTTFPAPKQEIPGGKLLLFQLCLLLKPEVKGALRQPGSVSPLFSCYSLAPYCIDPGKRKMKKSCLTDVMAIFENTGAENQSVVQVHQAQAGSHSCTTAFISLLLGWYLKLQPNLLLSPRAPVAPLIVCSC